MDYKLANQNMIDSQLRTNHITDTVLIDALAEVKREIFVPSEFKDNAYIDEDLPLGDQRFMLEPLIAAHMIQAAHIQPTDEVLVVAAATGYEAAIIAEIAKSVIAMEDHTNLRKSMTEHLMQAGKEQVPTIDGDHLEGYKEEAPFDVILLLGASEIFPENLASQLRQDGRLVYISRTEEAHGEMICFTKTGENDGSTRQVRTAQTPILKGFHREKAFQL